ncbi:MAG TPA: Smr/MutS family protein [Allosphingosinicella sp.]
MVASVRPLAPRAVSADAVEAPPKPPSVPAPRTRPAAPARSRPAAPGVTLDASWDRRLARGLVQPDAILDLHGHNLATAWDLLDRRLERAIREDARLLLLITGKPPKPERPPEPPTTRGAIRAAVGDWLAASRHAGRIAAVRNAHPRHGGLGALYIVLRRPRAGTPSF